MKVVIIYFVIHYTIYFTFGSFTFEVTTIGVQKEQIRQIEKKDKMKRKASKYHFLHKGLLIAVREAYLLSVIVGFIITKPQQHCIQSVLRVSAHGADMS